MLGDASHWIDSYEGSFLRLRYGCVAAVKIRVGNRREVTGTAGSIRMGQASCGAVDQRHGEAAEPQALRAVPGDAAARRGCGMCG